MELFTTGLANISTPATIAPVVAFGTGVVSVYSSTSGVVLPAFLPMVPDLAQRVGGLAAADRLVDEHRRQPGRSVVALDGGRAVPRRRRRRAATRARCSTGCWSGACRWPWSARALCWILFG